MLSYQHIYHAGHAADVVKHAVLAALLARLTEKPAPLAYLETHAGRGTYPLDAKEMQKTKEYETGLGLVLPHKAKAPVALKPYFSLLPAGHMAAYPGSPAVAKALTRPQDVLHLCEMHPGEVSHLRQFVKGDMRIKVHAKDGHATVPELLPLRDAARNPLRTLVLIDPSYEVKQEYGQTAQTVSRILKANPKAVVMVWYPLLSAGNHHQLARHLAALNVPGTWLADLTWCKQADTPRAYGTGLVVLNLPYQMEHELTEALDWLAPLLAQTMPGVHAEFLCPPV